MSAYVRPPELEPASCITPADSWNYDNPFWTWKDFLTVTAPPFLTPGSSSQLLLRQRRECACWASFFLCAHLSRSHWEVSLWEFTLAPQDRKSTLHLWSVHMKFCHLVAHLASCVLYSFQEQPLLQLIGQISFGLYFQPSTASSPAQPGTCLQSYAGCAFLAWACVAPPQYILPRQWALGQSCHSWQDDNCWTLSSTYWPESQVLLSKARTQRGTQTSSILCGSFVVAQIINEESEKLNTPNSGFLLLSMPNNTLCPAATSSG